MNRRNLIKKANNLLESYFLDEFDEIREINCSNLSKLDVAYTTTEDEEHEIQSIINFDALCFETYIDDILVNTEQYDSLQDLIDNGIAYMDFDELVSITDDDLIMVSA